jgi:hypothetical protein
LIAERQKKEKKVGGYRLRVVCVEIIVGRLLFMRSLCSLEMNKDLKASLLSYRFKPEKKRRKKKEKQVSTRREMRRRRRRSTHRPFAISSSNADKGVGIERGFLDFSSEDDSALRFLGLSLVSDF